MSDMGTASPHTVMSEHPDIVAMTARYEQASETPTAQITDGLTMLAGLFVALSPWIAGFNHAGTLVPNNLITGLAVAFLGMAYAAAYERTHRLTWVCPVLGVWAIIAPFVVSGAPTSTSVVLCNVIGGAVIVLLGLADLMPMYAVRRSEVRR